MKENRVKRILSEGGLALGTHVGGIADPQIVEIIGLAGFDAAFIDMEHTSYDLHDVQLAVMAGERAGITRLSGHPASTRLSSCGCWTWACRAYRCRMSAVPRPPVKR
jgi:2-keto-3-deoxy-L-rhamnonate aldolase RhmA